MFFGLFMLSRFIKRARSNARRVRLYGDEVSQQRVNLSVHDYGAIASARGGWYGLDLSSEPAAAEFMFLERPDCA